jgi:hypothetical protein
MMKKPPTTRAWHVGQATRAADTPLLFIDENTSGDLKIARARSSTDPQSWKSARFPPRWMQVFKYPHNHLMTLFDETCVVESSEFSLQMPNLAHISIENNTVTRFNNLIVFKDIQEFTLCSTKIIGFILQKKSDNLSLALSSSALMFDEGRSSTSCLQMLCICWI